METEKLILRHVLENAVKYNGKANEKAVLGKVLSENAKLRKDVEETRKNVSRIIKKINKLSAAEQKKEFEKFRIVKKEKKEKDIFEFLKIKGKIVSAFPPEPSKYLHIGHAKSIILNRDLAKKYNGKFILRFEDTNPSLIEKKFYDIILENIKWLKARPDKVDYTSEHIRELYELAEKLVKSGDAYVCHCSQEKIREGRNEGKVCEHRKKNIEVNLRSWKEMFSAKQESVSLRMKIDLKHKNTTMRDPIIMRIIDKIHPRQGMRYRLWPAYDFANASMDGIEGITYRLRSKEFELRNELQRYIQRKLGFKETKIYEFARLNLEGVESSGRVIREKIKKKELIGWDDPSLTTIVALRRRGFLPEAIKSFVYKTGLTKAEALLTWNDLIIYNKRILDFKCERYFFIDNPVKIKIKNSPEREVKLKLHPEDAKRGFRKFNVNNDFFIAKDDFKELKNNKLYRFMDCLNFVKRGNEFNFDSLDYEKYKNKGEKIMHWLPADNLVEVEILMPDKKIKKGLAENTIKRLKQGDVIQFERFGFCRLDEIKKDKYVFWFTHK